MAENQLTKIDPVKTFVQRVNREAAESLLDLGYSKDAAMQFVNHVAWGLVKNIIIKY